MVVRRQERLVQNVPTFEEAAREVHKAHSATYRNEKHAAQWINSFDKYAFPHLGARRVDQIEPADVLHVLSPIWNEIPETARRIRQRLKVVFAWARAKGFRSGDNPAGDVAEVLPKHSRKQQHHAALPYADVSAFVEALRANERLSVSVKLALEFLILTAARTSEVLHAKWSEIDLESEVKSWTVPAERMKAKTEHRVPLSPRCLEILEEAKKISNGGEHVFPGRSRRLPLSNMSFDMALRRMERDNATTHGFRSTFRDWAEEKTSFVNSVVEAALAHTVKNKVEAAYLRTKLFDKRREVMDAWAQFVTSAAAKVVRMRA